MKQLIIKADEDGKAATVDIQNLTGTEIINYSLYVAIDMMRKLGTDKDIMRAVFEDMVLAEEENHE